MIPETMPCGVRPIEIVMTAEETEYVLKLTSRLVEALMTAVICMDDLRTVVHAGSADANSSRSQQRPTARPPPRRIDPVGHLEREVTSPRPHARSGCWSDLHQYVTHLGLLRDVWDDEALTVATVRSVARNLRLKLREGDMAELAAAIRGHNGRYVLEL